MIEFLSCIHIHSEGEDLNEISKTKSIRMVSTLCGMASTDKYGLITSLLMFSDFLGELWIQEFVRGEGQKIVHKLMAEVSTQSSNRKPDFYLKFLQVSIQEKRKSLKDQNVQSMWLESPITFLHCVHEARMKKIVHLPPPSEKQIYIVQVNFDQSWNSISLYIEA